MTPVLTEFGKGFLAGAVVGGIGAFFLLAVIATFIADLTHDEEEP